MSKFLISYKDFKDMKRKFQKEYNGLKKEKRDEWKQRKYEIEEFGFYTV